MLNSLHRVNCHQRVTFASSSVVIFVIVVSILCHLQNACNGSPVNPSQSGYTRKGPAGPGSECPSSQHLASLAKPAKSRHRLIPGQPASVKCFCSPDSHPSEGWEITCLEDSPPPASMQREKVNPFTQTTRVNESTGAYPSISSTASDPNYNRKNNGNDGPSPMYTLSTSPLAFSVKNENGKLVEISCDSAVPDFKPAMFQGKFTPVKFVTDAEEEPKCSEKKIILAQVTGDCAGEKLL